MSYFEYILKLDSILRLIIVCKTVAGMSGAMISMVTRSDPALVAYAMKAFGRVNLTDVEWKKAEDHYKVGLPNY